jgi:hypothetical protein
MTAQILPFPQRGPFAVSIERDGQGWLVICRHHGWLFGFSREAWASAEIIAAGFGVAVEVTR